MIDGLDGTDACYKFAGIVGVRPHGLTLRRLWKMASGKERNRRIELFQLAQLVWGIGDIDPELYLVFGSLEKTEKGGPIKMSPKLAANVAAAEAKIRANNPGLPKLQGKP